MADFLNGLLFGATVVFVVGIVMPTGCNCTNPADRRCIYECAQKQMGVVECSSFDDYAVCGANGQIEIVRWSR